MKVFSDLSHFLFEMEEHYGHHKLKQTNKEVLVQCGITVHPEPCPVPTDFSMDACQDSLPLDLGDVYLESQGSIVQFDLTLKNICPGKRTALAVILTELDSSGNEQQRGMKTMTIPAHTASGCRDIRVECIRFILPSDLNFASSVSGCRGRNFKVRLMAHSIDTDFRCCD